MKIYLKQIYLKFRNRTAIFSKNSYLQTANFAKNLLEQIDNFQNDKHVFWVPVGPKKTYLSFSLFKIRSMALLTTVIHYFYKENQQKNTCIESIEIFRRIFYHKISTAHDDTSACINWEG